MPNLNVIFAKFDRQFNRGPNRYGYLTPIEIDFLVKQQLAVTMEPNTQKWVEKSIASGIMNSRWITLALTPAGLRREPGQRKV